jgi:glycosyltransferase involved in cell wall biosynthesis
MGESVKRVGLYCRALDRWGKGTSEYVFETVRAMLERPDPRLDLHILLPESAECPLEGRGATIIPLPATHRLLQDHWHASRLIAKHHLETVWFPKNVLPFGTPCRSVISFLDLAYFMPQYKAYGPLDTAYMTRMMRRSARKAQHLVAISERTRQDAIELLGVPEDRISTIYPVVSSRYQVVSDTSILEDVKRRYNLPERFFLYAGNLSPRKNLPRLFAAFNKVAEQLPHYLVLTGSEGSLPEGPAPSRLKRLGRIPAEDLRALYALTDAYCHLSLYEGFGFTVVEAQACGAPVLNSNTGCMPEIGGDACLYVDLRCG